MILMQNPQDPRAQGRKDGDDHTMKVRRLCILTGIIALSAAAAWSKPASARALTPLTPAAEHSRTFIASMLDDPKLNGSRLSGPIYEEHDPQAKLRETVAGWIRAIAEQHKLIPWQSADFHIEPLGPGSHGWIVHVLEQQSPVGYLIVTALEGGGYRLAEYGIGEQPIFHLERLRESLVQQKLIEPSTTVEELAAWLSFPGQPQVPQDENVLAEAQGQKKLKIERHYLYPFAAYWKVHSEDWRQPVYFDAITGEQYPLTKDPSSKPQIKAEIDYQPTKLSKLKDLMQLPKFDPYEDLGWIVEPPLRVRSIDDVIEPLRDKQRLTLTVELYDELVLLPYPIIGYAQWEQTETYLLIYSEGLRYVPLIDAVGYGHIYLEQNE